MQTFATILGRGKPVSQQEWDAILHTLVEMALIEGPEGTEARRVCFQLLGLLPKRPGQEITPLSQFIQGKMWEALEVEFGGKVEIYQDKFNKVRIEIVEDLNQGR